MPAAGLGAVDSTLEPPGPLIGVGAVDSTLPQSDRAAPQGSRLEAGATWGRYEIVRLLGRGGMGAVYLARDARLQREVALKVLRQAELADEADRERFEREAAATASLAHANIVSLYEVGDVDGTPFLAMEFVDGRALDELLREAPPTVPRALELVRDIGRALDYAHGSGLVHRDVKPANILVAADGTPRLADFGMARRERSTALTVSGAVIGTPAYMAPEQAMGLTDQVTGRSDVYALGAVLYELLTHTAPHVGETVLDVLQAAASLDPRPPRQLVPRLPRDVETITLKAMARKPARRYASAAAMADDIQRYLERRPILARRPSLAYRTGRWIQRHPLAALLLLLSVCGLGWGAFALTRPGHVELTVRDRGGPIASGVARIGALRLRIRDGLARGDVPAGVHTLTVGAPGHERYRGAIEVTRGGVHRQPIVLARHQGTFELEVGPAGATIFVDGVDYGSRLVGLKVDAGAHEILVRREGHHDARMTWVAERGKTRRGFTYLPPATHWTTDVMGTALDQRWIGDINGDGLPDFLSRHSTVVEIYNPWARTRLYSRMLGRVFDQFAAFADLDGDGRTDLCALRIRDNGRQVTMTSWTLPDERQIGAYGQPRGLPASRSPFTRPALIDLDRDGRPEVLIYGMYGNALTAYDARGPLRWVRQLDHQVLHVFDARDERGRLRLIVVCERSLYALDPASGAPLWRQPLSEAAAGRAVRDRVKSRAYHGTPWAFPLELDGTPGHELLIPVLGPDNADHVQLRAFDSDGTPLWSSPPGQWIPHPSHAGDVDGDGVDDICFIFQAQREGQEPIVGMLDGRTGKPRWRHSLDGFMSLVLRDDATPTIAQLPRGSATLELYDARTGEKRRTIALAAPHSAQPAPGDWDGDGRPEILVGTTDGTLTAYGPNGERVGSCLIRQLPEKIQAFGDVNGDGAPDMMVHGSGPALILGPSVRWARRFRGQQWVPPVSADFDGDGRPEVAVYGALSMFRGEFRFLDAKTGAVRAISKQTWARKSPLVLRRPDGGADLLVTRHNQLLRIRGADGTTDKVADIPLCFATPNLDDIDGDGEMEILLSGWGAANCYLVLNARTYEEIRRGPLPRGGWIAPRIAELDGKPGREMILHSESGLLQIVDAATGQRKWQMQLVRNASGQAPLLLDADGDGLLDLVCTSIHGSACFRGIDGRQIWVDAGLKSPRSGALRVDIDVDGVPEVVFGLNDGLAAVEARTGRTLWRVRAPGVSATLIAADLDGDRRPEIVSLHPDGTMRAYDARDGKLRWWFVRGKEVASRAVATDVDGDGLPELLVTGGRGHVYCVAPRLKPRR